jgi:hypothetical protein
MPTRCLQHGNMVEIIIRNLRPSVFQVSSVSKASVNNRHSFASLRRMHSAKQAASSAP